MKQIGYHKFDTVSFLMLRVRCWFLRLVVLTESRLLCISVTYANDILCTRASEFTVCTDQGDKITYIEFTIWTSIALLFSPTSTSEPFGKRSEHCGAAACAQWHIKFIFKCSGELRYNNLLKFHEFSHNFRTHFGYITPTAAHTRHFWLKWCWMLQHTSNGNWAEKRYTAYSTVQYST